MISFPIFLYYFRYAGEDGNLDVLSDMQEELTFTLMKTFHVNVDQAARLLLELKQCVKRKNLITIYRCTGDRDKKIELDEVIMTALFKAQHLSPTEQLSLALAWNRSVNTQFTELSTGYPTIAESQGLLAVSIVVNFRVFCSSSLKN